METVRHAGALTICLVFIVFAVWALRDLWREIVLPEPGRRDRSKVGATQYEQNRDRWLGIDTKSDR